MRKTYIIGITIVAILLFEFLASRTWIGREIMLSVIDPGPDPASDSLVVTNDVRLTYGTNTVGWLRAGQLIFQPCRHDLGMTEPFDPKIWKVYVDFGEDWASVIAYKTEMVTNAALRSVLRLERSQKAN